MIPPSNWQLTISFHMIPSEMVMRRTIESPFLNSKLVMEVIVGVKSISMVKYVAVESENLLVWSKYFTIGEEIVP
jgi:hypothetical protein